MDAALQDALAHHGKPDIFNTDQGSQLTGAAFTGALASAGITMGMDGKGAWRDKIFVEGCGAASNTRGSRFHRFSYRPTRNGDHLFGTIAPALRC